MLLHNNLKWTQPLDYENMVFCCRMCLQTSHLQNTCPQAKNHLKKKKKQVSKLKGWQFFESQEAEAEEVEILEKTTNENVQNPQESMQKNVEKRNSSIVPMPSIQEQQV